MKDKAIGIIIGIISGIIIFASIINLLFLYLDISDTTSTGKIYVWIGLLIQIIIIILMIAICLNYKKWKKSIIITIIFISILSFIIPIRKEEKWRVIEDTNLPGFFVVGSTISEKYKIYYNIYGLPIFQKSTGETQEVG